VTKHDDPMQIGLILNRFTGNKMFLDVAQSGSSKAALPFVSERYCPGL
jgi:hypothetical protein